MAKLGSRMYSLDNDRGTPATVYRRLSMRESPSEQLASRPIPSRKTSHYHIKGGFDSIQYIPVTNQIALEMEKAHTWRKVKIRDCLRVVIFIVTGVLTSVVGVILETVSHALGHFKYQQFEEKAREKFDGTFEQFLIFVAYRFVGVIVPVMVGAGVVTFIAPFAGGGGVAQSIAYLNGIRVPNVLSLKGLVVRVISTACTVVSGLAGGKEGPMMSMGTVIGGSLPSAFPYLPLQLEQERRDFAAAGFGAGLAVVFGAPIGGLLMALEEAVSFLEISLMWKIYLCCVFGYAFGTVLMSLIDGGEIMFNNSDLMSLGHISSEITEYAFFELLPFCILAVIGGLIGVLLIKIHIVAAGFRDHYVKTKTRKMIIAFIAGCIVVIFQVSSIWLMRSCSVPHKSFDTNATEVDTLHQMYCSEGERSDMSLLFSLTQGDILREFFGPDVIQMSSLGLYAVTYFVLLCITMILPISAGIFIPQIILGAAWGRLFGTFLNHQVDGAAWAKPAKYAYLGAAAQLSGTVGKTFSILVIFVEASGSISLSFPLMVIVSITRFICTFFVLPIYETQMHISGLPFLAHRPPPIPCDISTMKHMSKPPLVTLPPSPTVATIIDTLKGDGHNGYPIVGTGSDGRTKLIGLILRQQLLILLQRQAYKDPPPYTNQQMCECYVNYMKWTRLRLDERKVLDSVEPEYYNVNLDLSPYYNLFPNATNGDRPFIKTYELFRNLGIRHLVVITDNFEPLGMITRKDLAKFHTEEKCCRVRVKEMHIK